MMPDEEHEPIHRIVLVAAITAAVTGFVVWGIDELREKYGSAKRCTECEKKRDDHG